MNDRLARQIFQALDQFEIELPSWGFADTGTRFGKFLQPAAAIDIDDKLHDAGLVHKLTGACPTVAVHVLWDFKPGTDPKSTARIARKHGVKIGAINPNVFQDQCYKLGSFCSPNPKARKMAMEHTLDSIAIGKAVGSHLLSMWLADGTNYPGQDSIRGRWKLLTDAYAKVHDAMPANMTLLIEYKPFEPSFYHTDIMDWGASYILAKSSGRRSKVLVDTGHHLPGCNIEQIVALLLDENMLGGFHFNDRKYADDDLTLGSIDPYAVFRIFDQIEQYTFDTGKDPKLAYMVDQSHNLKPKLEAMVQTVMMAQDLYAKAAIVDRKTLAAAQKGSDIVKAERTLRDAFETDVRPVIAKWRRAKGLSADPLETLRSSGVVTRLGKERTAKRKAARASKRAEATPNSRVIKSRSGTASERFLSRSRPCLGISDFRVQKSVPLQIGNRKSAILPKTRPTAHEYMLRWPCHSSSLEKVLAHDRFNLGVNDFGLDFGNQHGVKGVADHLRHCFRRGRGVGVALLINFAILALHASDVGPVPARGFPAQGQHQEGMRAIVDVGLDGVLAADRHQFLLAIENAQPGLLEGPVAALEAPQDGQRLGHAGGAGGFIPVAPGPESPDLPTPLRLPLTSDLRS